MDPLTKSLVETVNSIVTEGYYRTNPQTGKPEFVPGNDMVRPGDAVRHQRKIQDLLDKKIPGEKPADWSSSNTPAPIPGWRPGPRPIFPDFPDPKPEGRRPIFPDFPKPKPAPTPGWRPGPRPIFPDFPDPKPEGRRPIFPDYINPKPAPTPGKTPYDDRAGDTSVDAANDPARGGQSGRFGGDNQDGNPGGGGFSKPKPKLEPIIKKEEPRIYGLHQNDWDQKNELTDRRKLWDTAIFK